MDGLRYLMLLRLHFVWSFDCVEYGCSEDGVGTGEQDERYVREDQLCILKVAIAEYLHEMKKMEK